MIAAPIVAVEQDGGKPGPYTVGEQHHATAEHLN